MLKAVRKANEDLISFCQCEGAIATTGQMDCPWCGCGWMFVCTSCRRAFVFGEVFEVDQTALELGRQMTRRGTEPDDDKALGCANWLSEALTERAPGDQVVFLDGSIHRVDALNVAFDGWFARHNLKRMPQAEANSHEELITMLGDQEYWADRELTDEEKC